ncbi:MAG: glycosyltransferase family 4 protein [Chloroflexota bacterium]
MPLRIAVDARLADYQQAGITTYTRSLLNELPALAPRDQFIVLRSRKARSRLAVAPNLAERRMLTPPHHRLEQVLLPLETALVAPDVVHSTDFIPCFRRRWRAIITIHDLGFLKFPRVATNESHRYYGQVAHACQSADLVIAVSHNTAEDLRHMLHVPEQKLRVIHEAASPMYSPLHDEQAIDALCARFGIAPGYFLFVSTIEPRKNLETVLRAMARLRASRQEALGSEAMQLVVVGRPGWLYKPTYRLVDELGLRSAVRFIGGAEPRDLLLFYNGARALVYPSLYEGFGLPPLEAMACGTPVLSANTASLPEVIGDGGLLLPPTDIDAWAQAMADVEADTHLREELASRGRDRARLFSWHRAAEQTLAVYREVMVAGR